MIVDDHPDNLGFLFEHLENSGFKVLVALDGAEALSQLEHAQPDLILLDIMMPGIDGYETCERIKKSPRTRDIPVIFMSARTDPQDKVRGFRVGAVDYVDKPVHKEEVMARVNAHIAVRRTQVEMRAQHKELARRNEELDAFSHMVAHDLRDALGKVLGYAEVLLDQPVASWEPRDVLDLIKIRDSALRMQDVIGSMLTLARISHSQVEYGPMDMGEIVERVVQDLEWTMKEAGAVITMPETWPVAVGYAPWVERVWSNYLGNGLKYAGDPPRLELGAEVVSGQTSIRFFVRDNGPGLSPDSMEKIFKPFVRAHTGPGKGLGIGLAIVHRIVKRLGGSIGVRNLDEGGGPSSRLPCRKPTGRNHDPDSHRRRQRHQSPALGLAAGDVGVFL